jgi:uncharacterized repeat protein (TIGR01451 family)
METRLIPFHCGDINMAGFWSRLFSRFSNKSKRRTRQRFLKVEMLENRKLMANDLAAITGVAYNDLTNNGLSVDDQRLAGVTIQLYRDANANGTFDVGTDTLEQTETTNAQGEYRFDNLLAGTYFTRQLTPSGFVQNPGANVNTITVTPLQAIGAAGTLIDDFDTTTQTVLASDPGSSTDDFALVAPEAIGGERDLSVALTSITSSLELSANDSVTGILVFDASGAATGSRRVIYDGIDGDATTLDATGLGGVDLTASDSVGFRFRIGADQASTLVVRVYSSATNFSIANISIPVTGGSPSDTLIVRYGDFTTVGGTGADFTNVGAIEFAIEAGTGVDARVDIIETASVVVQTADFQNFESLSLGNLVFRDTNNNGIADVGEPGIANVTVQLFEDSNNNGVFDSGTDTLVTTTTTNGSGNYLFTDLLANDYIVVIPLSNFNAGGPLAGMSTSTGNDPSPDPDDNVNGDDNGGFLSLVGVVSQAITLSTGAEPTNDGDNDDNTNLSLDFGFVPNVDVSVVKVDSPTTVLAGNQITYTMTVSNGGPSAADNVVLTDVLPAGTTFVSVNASQGTASNNAGTVTANLGTIAAGGSATVTLIVSTLSSLADNANVNNTATVTSDYLDTDPTNNTDSTVTNVDRLVDLAITKTDSPDPVLATGQLTYTLTVINNGPSDASGVVITDSIPATLNIVSATSNDATVSTVGNNVTFTVGNLVSGGTATATIIVSVADTTITTVANTATVTSVETDSNNANNSSTANTTVTPVADLRITKTDSADPVIAGGTMSYTLTVVNDGPSGATNVVVTDVLPAGLTFSSATASQGSVTNNAGTVTANLGNMANGATATITINVNVSPTATGNLSNTATVAATETDDDTTNNSDTETTALNSQVDIVVTKTDGLTNVISGNSLTYTILVTNNGLSQATNVNLTDVLPASLTYTSHTVSQGTGTATGQNFSAALGTLAPGASATVTITAAVSGTATGTITNTASVTSTETDTNTANNSATDDTTATPQIDLQITKTDTPDPVVAGNQLTYTIQVTNAGPSTATGVTVTDVLPSTLTFVSGTSTVGTVANNAGTVTGSIGTLASGASATLTLLVDVAPTARGTISNTATVTGTQTDSNTANNSATTTSTANGNIDLTIAKADSADPVIAGGTLTYTVTVTNNGPSTATNVVVTDVLPNAITFSSATASQGTVANNAGTVTANVGTLAPGATATITIVTNVPSSITPQTLSNTATVTATETDTNTNNNSATQTTQAVALSTLSGFSYIDANRNGVRDPGELPLSGVLIALSGTNFLGNTVALQATTDSNGQYTFDDLLPGTYNLQQTQPGGLQNGNSSVGTPAGGTAGSNQITNIVVNGGVTAVDYNFGEFRALSKRRFLASTN